MQNDTIFRRKAQYSNVYFDANDLQRTWCVSRALIKSDEVPGIVFSEVATGDRKIWVFRGQNL